MPTCWDETKGIGINDPFNHVTYTTDGTVSGPCPTGYDKRIPQVQLFVRINKYKGNQFKYQLADESDVFHVDFMNGWKEGSLEKIIDECEPIGDEPGYNPPCNCDEFLTESDNVANSAVCDQDVKNYILNEETEVVSVLPRGTCQGVDLIDKGWDVDPPFDCSENISPTPPPVESPDDEPTMSPVQTPTESPDEDDDECMDSELEFRDKGKRMRHCEWVADDPESRCKKKVKTHCPNTCDSAKYCEKDSKVKFELDDGPVKNCKWVKKKGKCGEIDMCNTCRATCADFDACVYFD